MLDCKHLPMDLHVCMESLKLLQLLTQTFEDCLTTATTVLVASPSKNSQSLHGDITSQKAKRELKGFD
jgi:hypothetical protein